jgi:hypothetical protein
MKVRLNTLYCGLPLTLLATILLFATDLQAGRYVFTVRGAETHLNGQHVLVKGLRCSNALISEQTTNQLITNLDTFASYGVNTISVYFMGSRFGDVKGYHEDGSLNPVYAARMGRIIEAADKRGMIVLVGCLYWGNSKAKWESWTQAEADAAVATTVLWLKQNNYRNVLVDVDNEGMARRAKGFDNRLMVIAGKKADPACVIATNFKGDPPPEADLGIHFSNKAPGKPYIESEGTPKNAPGGYWGSYSKRKDYYNYINIGLYNEQMKVNQKTITREHLTNGWGYMCASTWLQCPPPYGPNHRPGGDGSKAAPGIKWWLEYVRDTYGPYVRPPSRGTTTPSAPPAAAATASDGLIASPEPDWPQWRGRRRDGISDEKGLLSSWPQGGPKLLWKIDNLGTGWSSPIIVGDRLYITGDVGDDLVVFAFSLNGTPQWQTKNGRAWKDPYPGARACCAFSQNRVFNMNAHGRVACLDAASGGELWTVDILTRSSHSRTGQAHRQDGMDHQTAW